MPRRFFGYLSILAALIVAGVAWYVATHRAVPLVFAPTQMLGSLWSDYKFGYLEDNRTIDRQRQNVTTSEGQSYTMLRAVWMGDKAIFDGAWQWTKDNLDREGDRLSSWLFGQRPDGSWGVLINEGGYNSATDAEEDIALSLIFAYARWQDDRYLGDARVILNDLWAKEVFMVQGRPYLAANDLEKFSPAESAIVNPSYLAPYAYRIFATVDPAHDWHGLVDTSYEVLDASLSEDGLPPDWVRVNKQTGAVSVTDSLPSGFSYDALRVPWRIALDYQWYADERASALLKKMEGIGKQWRTSGSIVPTTRDGRASGGESPALYGGVLGYFLVAEPELAREVYETKLQFLFDPGQNRFKERLSYYDDNWAWFGMGLYHRLLPNLAASIPPEALGKASLKLPFM